jgi:Putative auto-transporter adhesin, head GIN domain
MKTKILFAIATIFFLTSCSKDKVVADGPITKIERPFAAFNAIEVSDGIDVILTKAAAEKVEVETNDNIQPYILTSKVGNKLIIKVADNSNISAKTIKVYVSLLNFEEIIANSGCEITSTNTLNFVNLKTILNDGSTMTANVICTNVDATITAGSKFSISGTSNNFKLVSTDGSTFLDYSFVTNNFNCLVKDGGTVKVTVNTKLDVVANNGSIINYKGSGVVNSQTLTNGSVINHF